jgi:pimeloyl-ACP methyl ester carboxylesterase
MAPTQFLDVPGGRLAYEVSGPDGAPLVLCAPGMGDLRGAFRFLTPLRSMCKAGKPADFSEYLRELQANLREPGRMAAVRGLLGSAAECIARIPELRCPVLIVMGSEDPDFPDAVAEARYAEQLMAPHATAAAVTTVLAALAHA